jgi:hypothetical protein
VTVIIKRAAESKKGQRVRNLGKGRGLIDVGRGQRSGSWKSEVKAKGLEVRGKIHELLLLERIRDPEA